MIRQQVRIPLLAVTCIGVFFTAGRLILDPNAGNHTVTPFTFPPNVPLPDAQLLESKPLNIVTQLPKQYNAAIAGNYYRYNQSGIVLDIEMRYVVGTLGDVRGLIKDYTTIQFPPNQEFKTVRYRKGVGFYGLFVYQNRAYLSSCINPRGGSTATLEQFLINRQIYDFRFNRLIPWLLGRESLRDRRCLWTHLSTPINNTDSDTYSVLEKAWFSWYQWWSSRFPKH